MLKLESGVNLYPATGATFPPDTRCHLRKMLWREQRIFRPNQRLTLLRHERSIAVQHYWLPLYSKPQKTQVCEQRAAPPLEMCQHTGLPRFTKGRAAPECAQIWPLAYRPKTRNNRCCGQPYSMQTPPFFRHTHHVTGIMAPAPVPERYPFHDNSACPIGQEIKRSGEWQYYKPIQVAETRARCPICIALTQEGK